MARSSAKRPIFSFSFSKARAEGTGEEITMTAPDYWTVAIVAMLVVLGTVMVYSASFVTAEFVSGKPDYYLWRHLIWVGVGIAGATLATLIDYHQLRRYSIAGMLLVLGLLLAILVLPASFAPTRYGAKRWLTPLGEDNDLQFQPSEIAKVLLILYAAHWLTSKGDKIRNFYYGLVPFALTIGFLIALVMGQPDLGTSLVIGAIGIGMFFIAGANILHMVVGLGVAGLAFFVLSTTASYRLDRWKAFLNPFGDSSGLTWHAEGNLIALGSGGLFGTGLGASRQKFLWLPNVFTDSIFAVIGEELGLIGASLVILLFVALAWRGMYVAIHAPDGFGRLVAAGVVIYVVSQALLNIAVTASLVPFTGVPLPLISYGGTSLAVTLTCVGLLLNVSRQMVADPRRLLIEEQRRVERLRRELLREQRLAERERREAQRKLDEAEHAERERHAQEQRAKEWHKQRERERELQRLREAEERAALRIRHDDGSYSEAHEAAEELPTVATHSFLNFQPNDLRLENTETEEQDENKPRLRKPRKDWAKSYEANRKREGRD